MVAAATLVSFVATSCGGKTAPTAHKLVPVADNALTQDKDIPDGLDLHVSPGKQGPPAYDRAKLAPAAKLGDAETKELLDRAAPLVGAPGETQAFAFRDRSQPPPRTGQVIKGAFPPPASSLLPPPAGEAKDLKVLRYMPEGKVPLAPELSITFSQPMVAVTSQDDAAGVQPVTLTPTPAGRWRWIGTRTILFDPQIRFPQATTYQVSVPAGTKSANGTALKDATHFTFETPPPGLVNSYPSSYAPQRRDVPMFAMFDQKIDARAAFSSIHVTADGKPWQIELVDRPTDKQLIAMIDGAKTNEQDGRWLAFHPVQPFPSDAAIDVEIAAGMPSAEGPNKTTTAQHFAFRTYAPLKIVKAECGWGGGCQPNMPFQIIFNNPLDDDKWDDAALVATPEIGEPRIVQSAQVVSLQGSTSARTTYKVAVAGTIRDTFGQTLGSDTTLTFVVGDAEPQFYGPNGLVVLDPAAKHPTLDFFTTNFDQLKVRLYQVGTADYDAYATYIQHQWDHDHPPTMPGKKVFDGPVAAGGKNELAEVHVDLKAALNAHGLGHVIAIVEPSPWKQTYPAPKLVAWVQSTRLAIDAHVDGDHLVAFATELATGKPAADVALELRPYGQTAKTDAHGLASIKLADGRGTKGQHYLIAKRGDDVAFVSETSGYYNDTGSWLKQAPRSTLAWYVIDDRKMYKPGEEVSLKGWLRMLDYGRNGDVAGLLGKVDRVDYKVFDQQNNQIALGSAKVDAVGGFDTKFSLPKTPNLGYATVRFSAHGAVSGDYQHGFQIEEFRRPEFEVSAQASQGPFIVGGSGDVTVTAKYFAGGPLPGAPVNWFVNANQTNFTPPNRDDFIFGNWQPWWGYRSFDDDFDYRGGSRQKSWTLADKTDATGAQTMHLDFLSAKPSLPMSVVASASVTDVNRQSWSASAAMIVHPSSLYVGLKTTRPFVDQGTPFPLDVIAVDLDGKAATPAKLDVRAVRLDWEYKHGRYKQIEKDAQACDPAHCEFQTPKGGSYKVTATVVDGKGRANQTILTFWVTGGDQPPAREVKQEVVQIIPDKKEYAPGQTAELLVQAPFYPAEAVVTWRRGGIVKLERLTFDGPSKVLKVPIDEVMTPNLYVQVDLVGSAARLNDKGLPDPSLPTRPAYAVGLLNLPIPAKHRTLAVTVSASAAKVAPGEKTKLSIEVRDALGKPVANAETAVLVVDEAILSLTGYKLPSPIDTFYPMREPDVRDYPLRAHVKLARPEATALSATTEMAPTSPPAPPAERTMGGVPGARKRKAALGYQNGLAQGDVDADGILDESDQAPDPNTPIAIRSNFNPLAAFAPAVTTDANGRATVDVTMPDNLTRYRIVAISAAPDSKQFGKGESAITARLPLMVRPSPPRFLNFGDTFKLPVVVQNQTDAPMTVKLAVRTTNARLDDGAGRVVTVPANDRVEVQFPAAAELAGTARFQIVGASGTAKDAAELALPVWTPATTEAFATYGVIDSGAVAQPVALPGDVVKQFGGLEVTAASTNLQSLTDAMLYLVHYPFECAEQRSSRIMSIAALRDVLEAFKVKEMPSKAAMEASVKADLEHLSQMQNSDGGYAYWDRGYPSEPYLSVYVANALGLAKAKGFTVPPQQLANSLPYLRSIEQHYPAFYSNEVRWAISAYALLTRKQLGDMDLPKAKALFAQAGFDHADKTTATMETAGWLLEMLAGAKGAEAERKALVRHAMNKVSETAGAANFTTGYADGNYLLLSSDHRVDAVVLSALIAEQPTNDLIPKIVTGLLAHRKAGRWLNTQENTYALLALDTYFHTYEKATPDFVARVWLGKDYAGDHAFKGRSTSYYQLDLPMSAVAAHDKQALTIQKDGVGRLYYRVGMTYAPASLKLAPADYGFVVQRRYEGVDDAKDVTRSADGTWHIKAGARVRVKLTMVNENRRYHVALVDPLPAGLETLNPALATTGPIPTDPKEQASRGAYWWWYGPWYEHQNLRDERVEAFAALLWEGVHDYTYVARATTPGNFVVPPPKAEEMYMPETFGRGGSDRVVIE